MVNTLSPLLFVLRQSICFIDTKASAVGDVLYPSSSWSTFVRSLGTQATMMSFSRLSSSVLKAVRDRYISFSARLKFGKITFSYGALASWNNLPASLHRSCLTSLSMSTSWSISIVLYWHGILQTRPWKVAVLWPISFLFYFSFRVVSFCNFSSFFLSPSL